MSVQSKQCVCCNHGFFMRDNHVDNDNIVIQCYNTYVYTKISIRKESSTELKNRVNSGNHILLWQSTFCKNAPG